MTFNIRVTAEIYLLWIRDSKKQTRMIMGEQLHEYYFNKTKTQLFFSDAG